MGLDYKKSKKVALSTILLLAGITVVEVIIALLGKGYIIPGFHLPWYVMGILMIGLSLFKAIKIIFEFMHMSYEVPQFAKSVLLPTGLLIWAVIAFMWEGSDWKSRRSLIENKNKDIEIVDVKNEQTREINTDLKTEESH